MGCTDEKVKISGVGVGLFDRSLVVLTEKQEELFNKVAGSYMGLTMSDKNAVRCGIKLGLQDEDVLHFTIRWGAVYDPVSGRMVYRRLKESIMVSLMLVEFGYRIKEDSGDPITGYSIV